MEQWAVFVLLLVFFVCLVLEIDPFSVDAGKGKANIYQRWILLVRCAVLPLVLQARWAKSTEAAFDRQCTQWLEARGQKPAKSTRSASGRACTQWLVSTAVSTVWPSHEDWCGWSALCLILVNRCLLRTCDTLVSQGDVNIWPPLCTMGYWMVGHTLQLRWQQRRQQKRKQRRGRYHDYPSGIIVAIVLAFTVVDAFSNLYSSKASGKLTITEHGTPLPTLLLPTVTGLWRQVVCGFVLPDDSVAWTLWMLVVGELAVAKFLWAVAKFLQMEDTEANFSKTLEGMVSYLCLCMHHRLVESLLCLMVAAECANLEELAEAWLEKYGQTRTLTRSPTEPNLNGDDPPAPGRAAVQRSVRRSGPVRLRSVRRLQASQPGASPPEASLPGAVPPEAGPGALPEALPTNAGRRAVAERAEVPGQAEVDAAGDLKGGRRAFRNLMSAAHGTFSIIILPLICLLAGRMVYFGNDFMVHFRKGNVPAERWLLLILRHAAYLPVAIPMLQALVSVTRKVFRIKAEGGAPVSCVDAGLDNQTRWGSELGTVLHAWNREICKSDVAWKLLSILHEAHRDNQTVTIIVGTGVHGEKMQGLDRSDIPAEVLFVHEDEESKQRLNDYLGDSEIIVYDLAEPESQNAFFGHVSAAPQADELHLIFGFCFGAHDAHFKSAHAYFPNN